MPGGCFHSVEIRAAEMSGPAATQPAATQPVERVRVDLSSPKAALETLERAARAGDVDGYLAAGDARLADAMKPMLLAGAVAREKAGRLEGLVRQQIGEEQAAELGKLAESLRMSSPLRTAVDEKGAIVWSRVKIAEEGDKATAIVEGVAQPIRLTRADGRWRVASAAMDLMPEGEVRRQTKIAVESLEKMSAGLAALEKKLAGGELNAANFRKQLDDSLAGVVR